MTKAIVVVILILFSISLIQEGRGKFFGSFATIQQVKIPELLNQLCNSSQGSNTTRRDACYGCFYRASIQPQGYVMLQAMAACANNYLNNTNYGHCQAYLQNATTMLNAQSSPTIIYCTFLECIRQVNKNSLNIDIRSGRLTSSLRGASLRGASLRIEQKSPFFFFKKLPVITSSGVCLRECVSEARGTLSNVNSTDVLVRLFVNTTACVLAKTRCSYMNPVTGELRDDDIINKLHLPSINAILVNTDNDINIVQLPVRYGGIDICTKYRNVQQATWPSVVC